MKKLSYLIVLLILVAFLVVPACANTISFSPLNLGEETLLISNSSGTLVGVYNTSTKGIDLNASPNYCSESYSIIVQPSDSDIMSNHPDTWMANIIAKIQTNSVTYIVILFGVALLIAAWRRR